MRWMRSFAFASAVSLATLGCSPAAGGVERGDQPVVLGPAGEGRVGRLFDRAALALRGPVVDAVPGDYVLEHAGMVAVVSSESGAIVDFGPEGGLDEIVAVSPTLFDGGGPVRLELVSIEPAGFDSRVLHVQQRPGYLPVRLHSFITFRRDSLVVESAVIAERPDAEGMAIGLGEKVGWGNAPTWLEGQGFVRRDWGAFTAKFLGREGRELSYALGFGGEASVVRVGRPFLPGFFSQARGGELTIASPDPAHRRTLHLRAVRGSIGRAAVGLYTPDSFVTATPPSLPTGGFVEIAGCKTDDAPRRPFARFERGEPIVHPPGCHEARMWAAGYPEHDWAPIEDLGSAQLGETGFLTVVATEGGKTIPARVQVRGVAPTKDPDWGEDPDDGSALNVAHAPAGLVSKRLPPGNYRVLVDRGLEYTVHDTTVRVRAGDRAYVGAQLERVVDTTGWLAADLHLHSAPSPDAPQSLEERVLSLAVSGVEVGVATDHNEVTDYRDAIARSGLSAYVASVIGDEVTTEDTQFGHFNVFPLEAGSPPLRYRHHDPRALLAESKSRAPLFADTIAQINHPRMGDIGYWEIARLDRDDVLGFVARNPHLPLAFDAVEVFNGDDCTDIGAVQEVLRDWVALERAGLLLTATGNSDSHRAIFHEPGMPRTYVAMPSDDPAQFDLAAFVRAIRERRVVVTSGPFVRLDVGGLGPGERVAAGSHRVRVEVDAPPQVDVAWIELIKNGRSVAKAEAPFKPGPHRATLETTIELAPGDSVFATVAGAKEIETMFRRNMAPFAFTNPVRAE